MLCHAGTNSTWANLSSPLPIYIRGTETKASCADNKYPSAITISLNDTTFIRNNGTENCTFKLWLTDPNGSNSVLIGSYTIWASRNLETAITKSISGQALHGKKLCLKVTEHNGYIVLRNRVFIEITESDYSYPVTVSSQTGGSCTASHTKAEPGTTVTIYPTPNTGYQYAGYTLNGTNRTATTFTMPSSEAVVVCKFEKKVYTITRKTKPTGAGTVTASSATASYGDQITLGQTPATGYQFSSWTTSPSVTVNSQGKFSMPNSNITVTANYKKRSTGTLSKTTFEGGETITLTISSESSAYTHKYQIDFSSVVTGMVTTEATVAAGVTSVSITIPEGWSDLLPSLTSKTGGKLVLKTYSGSSQVATSYEITGLTYNVPASVVPTLTDPVTEIVRTFGTTTYANVDETISGVTVPHYVQGHCGVRITATAAGAHSSTIQTTVVQIAGYTGAGYYKTATGGSLDFSSDILFLAGQTPITVTTTDSRGRTTTTTVTVNVEAYNNPSGSLTVWRVNQQGDDDPNGLYGEYSLTKSYSQIGTNALTAVLSCSRGTKTNPPNSGDIFPNDRKTFTETEEFIITLTLTDAFETTVIEAKLTTARYVIFINSTGKSIGFMKATTKSPPAGKETTFELPANCQVYIGDDTLEDYIESIVQTILSSQ